MINNISFNGKETTARSFVKASMNLDGTENARLLEKSNDLLDKFIGTDFAVKNKNHEPSYVSLFNPAVSYAKSHGQNLDILAI